MATDSPMAAGRSAPCPDDPSPRSWLDLAACQEVDPEIFFPISTTGAALGQIHEAQAICARCPVAADCLDWALRTGQGHGVWGGTTPEERRALRRPDGPVSVPIL